ncbi:hypothetical protein PMAYCL1PPCAC_06675, partial [Pristionchus mayeri]
SLALLSSSDSSSLFYTNLASSINNNIRNQFSVRVATSISSLSPRSQFVDLITKNVEEARIFVITDMSLNAGVFFPLFLAMIENGFFNTGEYAVVAFLSFDANRQWMSVHSRNSIFMGRNSIPGAYNVTEDQLIRAYRNLIVVSDSFPPSSANPQWKSFMESLQMKMGNTTNKYWDKSARDYDLLRVLSVAGMDMLNKGIDITVGENYWEYMLQRQFTSITGFPDYIDGMGMLSGTAQILYFSDTHESVVNLWPEEIYHVEEGNPTKRVTTAYSGWSVNWLGGSPPRDTPPCGFNGELCLKPKDRVLIIALSVGCTLLCALLVVAALLYKRYRYERSLNSIHFIIDRKRITIRRHVNLLSQRSLRSMKSMMSMASIGGSRVASQAVMNSHFIVEGEGEEKESRVESVMTMEEEDQKWNEIEEFAVGLMEGQMVGLKRIYKDSIDLRREIKKDILMLKEVNHENVLRFRGMVAENHFNFVVSEMANRGSIKDILENDQLPIDMIFLNQMAIDICSGLEYLHKSEIGCHGRMKSSNCLVDARWMVKLSSFGLRHIRKDEVSTIEGVQEGRDELWSAPEMLRVNGWLGESPPILIRKADIYSFSILLYEIFGRAGPWGETGLEPKEIIIRVRDYDESKGRKAFRPNMDLINAIRGDRDEKVRSEIIETIPAGWAENPMERPSIGMIRKKIRVITAGQKKTIMDAMVAMVENYTKSLETKLNEQNEELMMEKNKSEQLLKMMLPEPVADALKHGKNVTAQSFDNVTVFFSDCPGFTDLSSSSKPIEIVNFLNDLYTLFDKVIEGFDVYKVETIADSYMCVSGLPTPNGLNHAGEIASLGLSMLTAVNSFSIRHRPGERVKLRIGMNSGACVAGVIGLKMPRYCLFGDTVNTASRMESTGTPLHINCSQSARDLLEALGGYEIVERGLIEMKGKGQQMTYYVRGEDMEMRRERIQNEKMKFPSLRFTLGSGEEKTI